MTAIVIAAGGEGSRIGGAKPLRQLGGQRLIDHAIGWARAHSDQVAIATSAPNPEQAIALPDVALPLLPDSQAGQGPIAALASALAFAALKGSPDVLLIGCDMPFLPADLIPRLQAALAGQEAGAAIPLHTGKLHLMAGLWRSNQAALAAYRASGGQSLWGFARRIGLHGLEWHAAPATGSVPDPFANINGPADLAAAQLRATGYGYASHVALSTTMAAK